MEYAYIATTIHLPDGSEPQRLTSKIHCHVFFFVGTIGTPFKGWKTMVTFWVAGGNVCFKVSGGNVFHLESLKIQLGWRST